ncbi:MAG TPA: DUF4178 domain-containing protein [Candidatus Acidoferrum sp.]|nr:DUF4178 domain-containing protein [Candidatus Acidoferrum sp.]
MSSGLPPVQGAPKPQVKALNCPKCGAAITLRALGQAISVVCSSCHSVLDAKDPNLVVLQTFEKITSADPPLIPLGTRGKIRGTDYEVIGFERRNIKVEGIRYFWHEYVLFNPYKGFRYLTEYQGHWNDISICKEQPIVDSRFGTPPEVNYLGEIYRHFQTADANTDYVLGEFPWEVRVGEHAEVTDYVHPPRVVSREKMSSEVTWSIGEYIHGKDLWSSFRLPGSAPEAVGVYENEPSPFSTNIKTVWMAFAAFGLALLLIMIGFEAGSKQESVFHESYVMKSGEPKGENSFVTNTFSLGGRTSSVEVTTSAGVQNDWIYVNYALINQDTGQAWDFGREVSFYSGYDSDGSWKEGSQRDSVVVPSVPPGTYYLRIEPEAAAGHITIAYTVEVRRDVPVSAFYGIGFLALLIPAIMVTWRSVSFERSRWSESDHPPSDIFNTGGDN